MTLKSKIRPLRDKILVDQFKKGEQITRGGIIVLDDDGRDRGVRPRWAKVFAVGKEIDFVHVGDWILIEHGRWSREMKLQDHDKTEFSLWSVDPYGILGIADEEPYDDYVKGSYISEILAKPSIAE